MERSRQLVNEIYYYFDNCKDYGIRDRIQRAAISITIFSIRFLNDA